jgi:hypothetical protein
MKDYKKWVIEYHKANAISAGIEQALKNVQVLLDNMKLNFKEDENDWMLQKTVSRYTSCYLSKSTTSSCPADEPISFKRSVKISPTIINGKLAKLGLFLGSYAEDKVEKANMWLQNRAPIVTLGKDLLAVAISNTKPSLMAHINSDKLHQDIKHQKQEIVDKLLYGSLYKIDPTQHSNGTAKINLAKEKIIDYVLSLRNRAGGWEFAKRKLKASPSSRLDKVMKHKKLDRHMLLSVAKMNKEDMDDSLDGNSTEEEYLKMTDYQRFQASRFDYANKIPEEVEQEQVDQFSADDIQIEELLEWNDAKDFLNHYPYHLPQVRYY